jgi:hypothetical protein
MHLTREGARCGGNRGLTIVPDDDVPAGPAVEAADGRWVVAPPLICQVW